MIDIPAIAGRYYTIEILDLWGETIANLNERTIALSLRERSRCVRRGATLVLPEGAQRVDLPGRKVGVLARIESAIAPSRRSSCRTGSRLRRRGLPRSRLRLNPEFANDRLPGVEAFDSAPAILAPSPTWAPHAPRTLQGKVRKVAAVVNNPLDRNRVDSVIRHQAWAMLATREARRPYGHGWVHPKVDGGVRG